MNRFDLLNKILNILKDNLVICNIGLPSQELYKINDQPNFFYMLGSMGLSSSIGLGLALSQNKHVISIDGDGSVLMNMNTLATCLLYTSPSPRDLRASRMPSSA